MLFRLEKTRVKPGTVLIENHVIRGPIVLSSAL